MRVLFQPVPDPSTRIGFIRESRNDVQVDVENLLTAYLPYIPSNILPLG